TRCGGLALQGPRVVQRIARARSHAAHAQENHMNMIRIGSTSFVSLALTLSLAATNVRAHAVVPTPPTPPSPPAPPAISVHVTVPDVPEINLPDIDIPDLDLSDLQVLPDLSNISEIVHKALSAIPNLSALPALPDIPALPSLPAIPPFAFQDPKPVPKVRVYTDRDRDRDRNPTASNNLYEQARNSIEQEQYARALGQLDLLISRFDGKSLADLIANRVDAAMYWKAYALGKQR